MAVVNGTSAGDFIHRLGDGFGSGGLNEITGVTTGADQISGDVGGDLIYADAGADTVNGNDGNDTLVGGQGADRLLGGVGNDAFRILQQSDISGLAETINGGNDVDTLDFQVFQAIGAIDLTTATIIDVEVLALWSNDVTLTSAQLDGFSSIIGTGFTERLILSDGGLVDLSGANLSSIEELRGNAFINQINLVGVATGQYVNVLGGDDLVLGGAGADRIDGGTGNDSVVGGDGFDTLIGGDDSDTVLGGNGNDLIYNGNGTDLLSGEVGNDVFRVTLVGEISGLAETIDGGNDVDRLNFQTLSATGRVDLSLATTQNVEILLISGNTVSLTAAQLGAFETVTGGGFFDRIQIAAAGVVDLTNADILFIDEFRGTAGGDTFLFAGAAGNMAINTLNGADSVSGGGGNDTLIGGLGTDWLAGQAGTDFLTGGSAADTFAFDDLSELGLGAARDLITDFVHGQDIIRLTLIDADLNTVGDQQFVFIAGAAFNGTAGQLRYSGGILSGDVDGDAAADFQIALTGAPVLTSTDLQL